MTELPKKFIDLQLFPAVILYNAGESVRMNFDKDKWLFKEFDLVLQPGILNRTIFGI